MKFPSVSANRRRDNKTLLIAHPCYKTFLADSMVEILDFDELIYVHAFVIIAGAVNS